MPLWKATLEVVTPMALGGASPTEAAEWRAATLKPLLRKWWRTARGVLDQPKGGGMDPNEAALFGSTDWKSPFSVHLVPAAAATLESFDAGAYPKGIQYLAYGLDTKKGKERTQRQVLVEGARAELRLGFPHWWREPEKQAVWASLWLLVWFGGMGTRSRRGFGVVRVTEADSVSADEDGQSLAFTFPEEGDLGAFLKDNLAVARKWIGARPLAAVPLIDTLDPNYTTIKYCSTEYSSWEKALDAAGTHLQKRRSHVARGDRSVDATYRTVSMFIKHHALPKAASVKRAAYGLPLPFYFRSLRAKATIVNRRASPLWVRVYRLADKRYVWGYVLMDVQMPDVKIETGRDPSKVVSPPIRVPTSGSLKGNVFPSGCSFVEVQL